jgi:hypothetical protein
MKSFFSLGVTLLALSTSLASGAVLRAEPLDKALSLVERNAESEVIQLEQRQTGAPASPCTHGPTNRGCWTGGFSINTDQYASWPNTGRTVTVSQNSTGLWDYAKFGSMT